MIAATSTPPIIAVSIGSAGAAQLEAAFLAVIRAASEFASAMRECAKRLTKAFGNTVDVNLPVVRAPRAPTSERMYWSMAHRRHATRPHVRDSWPPRAALACRQRRGRP